ncbi:MAG: hypothetical protein JETT_1358 [Candidatus Jettenia ecosi]|uniref:Uncharacterized protein n=1 Tax=Candidatus Jettenia ecosi TaxID=2494326 RepID=A0A533QC66_9BACT|nr:MAG: hypothetical protein JETT_1358 [Candidatus Jettenia ecosi]
MSSCKWGRVWEQASNLRELSLMHMGPQPCPVYGRLPVRFLLRKTK